jgi:Spy/CpxP family protein refolding chaperone
MSRTFVVTFTLLLSLAVAAQTTPSTSPSPQATTPGTSATPSTPNEPSAQAQAHESIENVSSKLNLSADQKAKLEPILTEEIQLIHDLRANTTMTVAQKREKFRGVLTADHAKIDAILTPEQKQKLTEMNQAHESQQGGAAPTPAPNATPGQTPDANPMPKF